MSYLCAGAWLLVAACLVTGCATAPQLPRSGSLDLPVWLTEPSPVLQEDAPVSLHMSCPAHLEPFCDRYKLPAWVVYGVVRCLGADEFLVNGVFRRFSIEDEFGESNVVVDKLHYDVARRRIERRLSAIARAVAEAETELDRMNVLGSYVRRRFGAFVLFSLAHADAMQAAPENFTNLLLDTGESLDEMERFNREVVATLDMQPGWSETEDYYQVVQVGDFGYGNPMDSFRRTEEEGIHELARSLVVKFSHLQRQFSTARSINDSVQEDAVREEIALRMRGVRVLRRVVDPGQRACLVTVRLPCRGVARK
ncbi:MAG: hypothetical protein QGH42_07170 [Kiritimatiellia bacterium]|nr:hypothetical protein [Kiritimatiellia bacterium]MDP6811490.1 hypothetical protein [Kiritimatiellia bacterium]MDP7024005.1 hypothetical protein [Kiritimatiellia bacterium]